MYFLGFFFSMFDLTQFPLVFFFSIPSETFFCIVASVGDNVMRIVEYEYVTLPSVFILLLGIIMKNQVNSIVNGNVSEFDFQKGTF